MLNAIDKDFATQSINYTIQPKNEEFYYVTYSLLNL